MFFFFNDTATTEIYTLSLHDALPIFWAENLKHEAAIEGSAIGNAEGGVNLTTVIDSILYMGYSGFPLRSEEHTSELQSQSNLVCRLLLEKKKSFPMLYA